MEALRRVGFDLVATLSKFKDLGRCDVLDLGCGSGRVSLQICDSVKSVTGVDVRRVHEFTDCNVRFVHSDLFEFLDFNRVKFDIIIVSEVIEHLEDLQGVFLLRLKRHLKKDGIVYLTTNNKLWPIEGHYGLPLLTYLPGFLQEHYIRLFNRVRGDGCDIRLFTYSRLRNLFISSGFVPEFIVPEGLRFPFSLARYLRGWLWNFSKGFVVVAKCR